MNRAIVAGAVAVSVLITGCQTQPLKIRPFAPGGDGAPYSLRHTQFETKVKWRVTSCGKHTPRAGENPSSIVDKEFSVQAEVSSEPSFPDDPGRRWLIDLSSLDGPINTTEVEITYDKGRFKSFNATVTDRTVETATAVLKTAATVGLALAGAASVTPADACADLVYDADLATASVKSRTNALVERRRELTTAQAMGLPKKELSHRAAAVQAAVFALEDATADLATKLGKVTYEQTIRWPTSGAGAPSLQVPVPKEAVEKWSAARWNPSGQIHLLLELKVFDANGNLSLAQIEDSAGLEQKVATGRIPVRIAKPGALVVTLQAAGAPKELQTKEAAILQSGDLVYVPVSYRWPRSSVSGFGIDADGYLSSMTHKQTSAPAETVAKVEQAAAEQLTPLFPSKLDKLKAENADLEARKSNAELKKALAPPAEKTAYDLELAAIQSDLALKKARLELTQTEAALKLLVPE